MISYPSIESVWQRSKETGRLLFNEPVRSRVWEDVGAWYLTEKVDGTNIRIILGMDVNGNRTLDVRGRTDKAQLPGDLVENITAQFTRREMWDTFDITSDTPRTITLYGEGYGPKIQKNGHLYRPDKGFILFDVRQGNAERGFWWDMSEVAEVAADLDIPMVPVVGFLSSVYQAPRLWEEMAVYLPFSYVAQNAREAEGIVARPRHELQDAHGNRVMWKLTYRDLDRPE